VKIGNFNIGPGCPVFIIAEAGVNHDGCLEKAKRLVEAAKAAGAQAVKFQTFSAKDLVTASAPKADYQIENTGAAESQLRMLEKLELGEKEFQELAAYCREQEILFLSTPYGARDIQLLGQWNVSALKVASALAVEPRFLKEAAALGVPLIVSTGMMTMAEVADAAKTLQRVAPGRFVLLQCVTNYPATVASSNLRAMLAMAEAFCCPVGFSDHTETFVAGSLAAGLGACVLERHLTLDRSAEGPDHRASSNPEEFAEYVRVIREAESALGDGVKRPAPEEMRNLAKMRRSVVAVRDLEAGKVLCEEDFAFKRPAGGIPPADWENLAGCRLRQAVARDEALQWSMLESDAN
jgi:sialic acid synthase SpsE